MRNYFKILLFCLLLGFPFFIFSQDISGLEKEKSENISKISYTKELLKKTASQKEASLTQISLLNEAIKSRESLISNFKDELLNIEREINNIENQIDKNEDEIAKLKLDYAKIVKSSYRIIEKDYIWMYILSSQDLNQAYQRFKYIKYLNDYRRSGVIRINSLNDSLVVFKQSLSDRKNDRMAAIDKVNSEQQNLKEDKHEKDVVLKSLKSQENKLRSDLRKMEAVQKKIEEEIRKLIAAEANKAKAENRVNRLTPSEKLISDNFVLNRGRLPWPTETGIITGHFGEQNHPVLRGIKIRSNGIDISTKSGATVRSAFDGEVTRVIAILGANFTVIIKHGDYRTVYQNLVDVKVKVGDKVKTKQVLGTVYTNEDNISKVHFEIWKSTEPVDPRSWLSK